MDCKKIWTRITRVYELLIECPISFDLFSEISYNTLLMNNPACCINGAGTQIYPYNRLWAWSVLLLHLPETHWCLAGPPWCLPPHVSFGEYCRLYIAWACPSVHGLCDGSAHLIFTLWQFSVTIWIGTGSVPCFFYSERHNFLCWEWGVYA